MKRFPKFQLEMSENLQGNFPKCVKCFIIYAYLNLTIFPSIEFNILLAKKEILAESAVRILSALISTGKFSAHWGIKAVK